jgi:hypothetical protein
MKAREHEKAMREALALREAQLINLQSVIERQRAELRATYAEIERIADMVHAA